MRPLLVLCVFLAACNPMPSAENCRFVEIVKHCIVDIYCEPTQDEMVAMKRHEKKCEELKERGVIPDPPRP